MDVKMETDSSDQRLDPSRWTDDQELTLLKAVLRYKPVGMHKHFRMLAIHEFMLKSGTVNTETDTHVSIPGIWAKLKDQYDLAKLDEREDAIVVDTADDDGKVVERWRDFELPGEDFEAKMWERRLAPDGTQSPDDMSPQPARRRESTIADSEDPRSSPLDTTPGPGKGSGASRGTRSGRKAAGGRLAEVKDEVKKQESSRSSRRTSKAATPAEEEDHDMPDADQQEEDEGSGEESEEGDGDDSSEQENESEDDSNSKRNSSIKTRGRGSGGGRRGRPRRARRRG